MGAEMESAHRSEEAVVSLSLSGQERLPGGGMLAPYER